MSVLLKSNEYWGRRGGMIYPDGSKGLPQNQWGGGSSRDGKSVARRFVWPMRRKLMGSGNLGKMAATKKGGAA